MATFQERIEAAKQFEDNIISFLKNRGFEVARLGSEHTLASFMDGLKRREDITSAFLRCMPDIAAYLPDNETATFLVDAKASIFIERLPYENYMRLEQIGVNIVIVFQNNHKWA